MTGTVFAFLGGRDRIGTTTTAVSVATSMAETATRVAVIDAAFDTDGIDSVVDVPASDGVRSVLRGDATLDEAMATGPHGVEYLCSGNERPAMTDVRTHRLRRTARTARERYDVVLLDLGHGGGVDVAMGLELADETILVSGSADDDLAATAEAATVVRHHDCRVRGTVLSRVPSVQAVDTVDVTEQLQTDLLAVVPDDDAVRSAADAGESLLRHDPDSDAAMVYWQLAASLTGTGGLTGPVLPASAAGGDTESPPDESPVEGESETEAGQAQEPVEQEREPPEGVKQEREAPVDSTGAESEPADASESEPADATPSGAETSSTGGTAPAEEPDATTAAGETTDLDRPDESSETTDGASPDQPASDGVPTEPASSDEQSPEPEADSAREDDRTPVEQDTESRSEPDEFEFVVDGEDSEHHPDLDGDDSARADTDPGDGGFELPGFDSESEVEPRSTATEGDSDDSSVVDSSTPHEIDAGAENRPDDRLGQADHESGDAPGSQQNASEQTAASGDTGVAARDQTDGAESGDDDFGESAGSTGTGPTEVPESASTEDAESGTDSTSTDPDSTITDPADTSTSETTDDDGKTMFDDVSPDPESLLDDDEDEEDDEINALFKETMDKVTGKEDDEE